MKSQPVERHFQGQPASPGICLGPAYLMVEKVESGTRAPGSPEDERQLLDGAIAKAIEQLRVLAKKSGELAGEILEFQLALLEDDDLLEPIHAAILEGKSADTAWAYYLDREIADYALSEEEYMAARSSDLADLRDRILHLMLGNGVSECVPDGSIIITGDLPPSVFLDLDRGKLAGVAMTAGSPTSHVAILARSRGIPMLVGIDPAPVVMKGELLAMDANAGQLLVSPGHSALKDFNNRLEREKETDELANARLRKPAKTRNGKPISILLNVNEPGSLDGLDPEICEGIGLTRTEFLFDKASPSEETQFEIYAAIVKWAEGRPVTFRTLDAGGDKPVRGYTVDNETNPFLGIRGIRLSMRHADVFATQLRALARAARLGPVKIMLPMVTVPSELAWAREQMDRVISKLTEESVEHQIPRLGIMVEVPAAALNAEAFDADFFSIGSNDLVQYTLAAGRDATGLAHLVDPRNPAILHLIRHVADIGRKKRVEVSICGDMASDPEMVPILLDCGIKSLSVSPPSVARVKLAISRFRAEGR